MTSGEPLELALGRGYIGAVIGAIDGALTMQGFGRWVTGALLSGIEGALNAVLGQVFWALKCDKPIDLDEMMKDALVGFLVGLASDALLGPLVKALGIDKLVGKVAREITEDISADAGRAAAKSFRARSTTDTGGGNNMDGRKSPWSGGSRCSV